MDDETDDGKSFGPQLFVPSEPSAEWDVEQLGSYAKAQHQQIVDGEMHLTPAYWRLGRALHFARKSFAHGQWVKFLEQWGIHRTRAAKARAIFRTFENDAAVQNLAVDDAYEQRSTRRTIGSLAQGRRPPKKSLLGRFAKGVFKEAESLIDEAAFVEPQEAIDLLVQLDNAIEGLQRLWQLLQAQADTAAGSGQFTVSMERRCRSRLPTSHKPGVSLSAGGDAKEFTS